MIPTSLKYQQLKKQENDYVKTGYGSPNLIYQIWYTEYQLSEISEDSQNKIG